MDVLCAENLHSRVWFDKWPYDACAHACDCMATDIPPSHSSLLRARAILFFFGGEMLASSLGVMLYSVH